MNPLYIFLTQTVTGAVTEIILLLLGAALIGFFTAWFYQKSFYVPIIKKLESEKEELTAKVAGLNAEVADLKSEVAKLNDEKTRLTGETENQKQKLSELGKLLASKDAEIETLKKAGRG